MEPKTDQNQTGHANQNPNWDRVAKLRAVYMAASDASAVAQREHSEAAARDRELRHVSKRAYDDMLDGIFPDRVAQREKATKDFDELTSLSRESIGKILRRESTVEAEVEASAKQEATTEG